MGDIGGGEEWLAITFNNQDQIEWSDEEFEKFTKMSSSIVQSAYERMSMQNPEKNHAWASPTRAAAEVDFLIKAMNLSKEQSVLDFGCGSGRHAKAFADRGFKVLGVDFSQTSINRANAAILDSIVFKEGDCREIALTSKFDVGLCLYDVIGSFPDDESNQRILNNLSNHLCPGALVAFSVMSFEYIDNIAKNKVGNGNVQKKLNELQASNFMQSNGEIFDPDRILLDTRNKVAYRREIFDNGTNLRTEVIVRDRRYTFNDLITMCGKAGLQVLEKGYVKAGCFELVRQQQDRATKEILVIAKKSLI